MNVKTKIFIGVAWPYVNGNLHIGHVAGYLLPADITARAYRLMGHKVLMVSGSDCFGTPITVEADKKKVKPDDIVNEYHPKNVKLFKNLGLTFDLYTKTNTENHKKITQEFLLAFWEKGLIDIQKQEQYYSESENKFLPDRYVEGTCPYCGFDGARSDQCDNCGKLLNQDLKKPTSKLDGKKVVLRGTDHLYICWDKLQKDIERYVNENSINWRNWVLGQTKNWLDEGLKPRAVTRDLDWGVPIPKKIAKELPNSESKRIYVWFDAVIGYYSASVEWADKNNKNWENFWIGRNLKHYYFMGKDNLVFHTIFWPGQLMTYDLKLKLPDQPAVNQFLNLDGKKFSKSRGVVIDTAGFIKKYSSDALRFALTTIMPENSDSSFTMEDFLRKNNDLLVGHIGNYINRTLHIYAGVKLKRSNLTNEITERINTAVEKSKQDIRGSKFKDYVNEILELSNFANEYFNDKKPWILKKNDEEKFKKVGADLFVLTYAIAMLMEPITPNASSEYLLVNGLENNELWKTKDIKNLLSETVDKVKLKKPKPLYAKYE
ncbi:methionine--tRNA ligase [Candidatus Woesebacteria bacterium RIFCSPHIGHO2_01_FULL_39_32]|uniref:Methionine--tRNA ligase n=2 Tax=Candidatus Woeseibacteriota TaxID=1752722 RepID=A0A0G0SYT6_9BACT|nr:MAG: Methionyl-tRNA synthetase [Candidatus Woesebacteria bacterium GW2011_GWA1_39_8]OGM03435.1 MAG: methionine--tRNA ligase [Candidatus Woesebacteria bacterium GWB1_37_5]OGM23930.1 MAG: methionine--tRNA ligase [Candidatus Woesebacteria bacterium RIFCSPHIGHO2_01_FULL_39_32]OGM37436.1 MAG: methionine--tRNA ligase [Candidatus Woesebacteria bacterium RIFCSPHIGHO2_12_FULL_38_11]OGM64119.1 MAG: methionine--tRNA ligase [Candidatus Woesebacteria bacterium RIFCSPLOWO2_01_FULL_39_25]